MDNPRIPNRSNPFVDYFFITYLDKEKIWANDKIQGDQELLSKIDFRSIILWNEWDIIEQLTDEFISYDPDGDKLCHLFDLREKLIYEQILQKLSSKISGTLEFLEYQLERFYEKSGEIKSFLFFMKEMIYNNSEIPSARKQSILEWIEEKRQGDRYNLYANQTFEVDDLTSKKLPDSLRPELTAAQIGLFFYYLAEGKHITRPGASDFRKKKFHQEKPYYFTKSGNTVYVFFNHPEITKDNLNAVIPMLKDYPAAKRKAQDDEYSLNIE